MKIKKLENGNIQVIENGKVIKSFSSTASLEFTQGGEAVGLFYNGSNIFDFYPTEVQELEVAPAPAVAFSGEVEELLEELSLNFFFDEVEGAGAEAIVFQEQDITQDTTQAIYFIRHTFNDNLEAGTYQIDSYQYLEILGGNGEIRNGIFIDTVLINDIRNSYLLSQKEPLLNRYIFVHAGGTVKIDAGFRRSFAATSATCTLSNLIIKKIS
jgi:hypothetical protein